jgi:1-acyl-sn-glycerol-3-phosphate acyltransferase
LKQGIQFLNEGQVLCLFPEGTRSKSGEIGKGLTGAGFFALRSDAAVVPVAISGRYGLFRRVNVVIGRPVPMQDLRTNKAKAEEATEVIMEEIKAVHQQAKAGNSRLPSG